MADEMFQEKAPWWLKAPAWLSLGIVGVPSLGLFLCLGYIFYTQPKAQEKTTGEIVAAIKTSDALLEEHIKQQTQAIADRNLMNVETRSAEERNDKRGEQIISLLEKSTRLQGQTCINSAKDLYQARKCMEKDDAAVDDNLFSFTRKR